MASNIPILIYHRFQQGSEDTNDLSAGDRQYLLHGTQFEDQLNWLRINGFTTMTIEEFIFRYQGGHQFSEKTVLITFDDGYEEHYTMAYPLLRQYGHVATFFAVTGLVGSPGYADWDQLIEMKGGGMSIQSHTHNHPFLSELPDDQIYEELKRSKDLLDGRLHQDTLAIALPGGDTKRAVKMIAIKAGYKAICTSIWGFNNGRVDLFSIKRIGIKRHHDLRAFEAFLEGRDRSFLKEKLVSALLNMARRLIGVKKYSVIRGIIFSRLR